MKRLVLFLISSVILCGVVGCTTVEDIKQTAESQPWASDDTQEKLEGLITDHVKVDVAEGEELLCLCESEAEAKEIADQYGITFVNYDYGVATFTTDKDLQEVIQMGKDNGWTELSMNHVTYIDDPVLKIPEGGFDSVKMIEGSEEELIEDMSFVNESLQEVSDSERFQNGNDTVRYTLLSTKLTQLEMDGHISKVRYNSEEKCFYFIYAYGSEGGWSLHPNEWDPMTN